MSAEHKLLYLTAYDFFPGRREIFYKSPFQVFNISGVISADFSKVIRVKEAGHEMFHNFKSNLLEIFEMMKD